jgi:hypothetical protein
MSEDKTFIGIPVEGEIEHFTEMKEQWPLEQLQPLFQAVIDDPMVGSFGWNQYTPYFNDGDACVFNAYGLWIRKPGEVLLDIDHEDYDEYFDDNYEYEVKTISWKDEPASPQHHIDLYHAINGGHFDAILSETFGDPADVTFQDGKFTVEFCEHD